MKTAILKKSADDLKTSEIMWTTNFKMFKYIKGNRPMHDTRLVREELQKYGAWKKICPLICNQNHEVLDGQNRLFVAQEIGFPGLYYQIVKTTGRQHDIEIIKSLQIGRNWTTQDFLISNKDMGLKSSSELLDFSERHQLPVSNAIIICCNGSSGDAYNKIRSGRNFAIDADSNAIAEYLNHFSDMPFYKTAKFILAIRQFYKKATREQREKLKENRLRIIKFGDTQQYLAGFSNIVNKYARPGKEVYF